MERIVADVHYKAQPMLDKTTDGIFVQQIACARSGIWSKTVWSSS